MTARRPEHDAAQEYPRGRGTGGSFEEAVGRLDDPLNDPLPGGHPPSRPHHAGPDPVESVPRRPPADRPPTGGRVVEGVVVESSLRPRTGREQPPPLSTPPRHYQSPQQATYGPQEGFRRAAGPGEWYAPAGHGGDHRDWYGQERQPPHPGPVDGAPAAGPVRTSGRHASPAAPDPVTGPYPASGQRDEVATALIPVLDERATGATRTGRGPEDGPAPDGPAPGGRAERRRAAKAGTRRRAPRQPAPAGGGAGAEGAPPARPMSRVEARKAARAAKDSPAVVVSRVTGELFISLGVLMLLFVAYQLWWTNVRADRIAGQETHKMQDQWATGDRDPGTFAPGQGFAVMHIPKLDVVAPIAEGTSKEKVLDRGMIGHYSEGSLKTAMPSDPTGNFAVAGHRNTHGEPFRYVNRLVPGDKVVVETQDAYYTYEMVKTLAQTSPSNVSVISPVPAGSGFTAPGRYLTLTTCTPEFTSTYRLIVWGKMVEERPRSEGKPDALLD
ncbi:class E sortase [Streptomyces sp. NBC_00101]|uniref:class E sortase n=1 Tax=Streptomyces sp. NBC_00101 TaxID=2975651 RepID=UPI0032452CC9